MHSLAHPPAPVQPGPADPVRYLSDPAGSGPGPLEVAYDLGYDLAVRGEDAHPPRAWHPAESIESYRGMYRARSDRKEDRSCDC